MKVAIGDAINESGILQDALDGITDAFTTDTEEMTNGLNNSIRSFNNLTKAGYDATVPLQQAELFSKKLGVSLIKLTDPISGVTKLLVDFRTKIKTITETQESQIVTLDSLELKLKDLNDQFSETDENDKKKLSNLGKEILKTKEVIAELEKYRQKQEEIKRLNVSVDASPGLLKTAQAYTKVQEEAKKASEEIGKFINAFNPVSVLPEKIEMPQSMKDFLAGVQGFKKQVKTEIMDIGPMVASGIVGLADAIGQAFASGNFKDFGKGLLESVASFAQQLGSMMVAIGIGEIALKGLPGPAKIAAGLALVAAGAAVKSLLSKQKSFPAASSSGGGGRSGGSGFSSPSGFGGQAQNSEPIQVEIQGVLRGEDLHLAIKNYQGGKKFTSTTGG
jgi:hypothetical protein